LVALLATTVVAGGAPAIAAAADGGDDYRAYAQVRERLIACSLDSSWDHLSDRDRKRCKRLRRLYVLWSNPGESYRYHVHCRTAKCPATPEGEPDARAPIPQGARTFR
jgi:hypothetical protein